MGGDMTSRTQAEAVLGDAIAVAISSDYSLGFWSHRVQRITASNPNLKVLCPAGIPDGGPAFYLLNDGTNDFDAADSAGTPIGTVAAGFGCVVAYVLGQPKVVRCSRIGGPLPPASPLAYWGGVVDIAGIHTSPHDVEDFEVAPEPQNYDAMTNAGALIGAVADVAELSQVSTGHPIVQLYSDAGPQGSDTISVVGPAGGGFVTAAWQSLGGDQYGIRVTELFQGYSPSLIKFTWKGAKGWIGLANSPAPP